MPRITQSGSMSSSGSAPRRTGSASRLMEWKLVRACVSTRPISHPLSVRQRWLTWHEIYPLDAPLIALARPSRASEMRPRTNGLREARSAAARAWPATTPRVDAASAHGPRGVPQVPVHAPVHAEISPMAITVILRKPSRTKPDRLVEDNRASARCGGLQSCRRRVRIVIGTRQRESPVRSKGRSAP